MATEKEIEPGTNFDRSDKFEPRFDSNGLITAISQDIKTGEILMVASMNKEALDATIKTGQAVFYSRSRKKLWKKGEKSGHIQKVKQILVDCDQDCLILKVEVDAGQCHIGYKSCFYRTVKGDSPGELEVIAEKVFDPEQVYKKK